LIIDRTPVGFGWTGCGYEIPSGSHIMEEESGVRTTSMSYIFSNIEKI
jgi:hypothetical protein